MRLRLLILTLLLPAIGLAQEYRPEQVPNVQKQDYRHLVSDPEGYFSENDRARIDQALVALREKHTVEVALVVLPGIYGDDPEHFTNELFELWGIGKAGDDNGLLILYVYGSAGNRIIRFETGYGLEGALPDITTKQITNRTIVPHILDGEDAEGFIQAASEIDRLLGEEYEARNEGNVDYQGTYGVPERSTSKEIRTYLLLALTLGLPLALFFVARWRRANRLKRLRNCPKCGTKGAVSLLEAPANEPLLLTHQLAEQRIGSVRYIVCDCTICDYRDVIRRVVKMSGYTNCPNCGNRTYRLLKHERISRSRIRETYECSFCHYTKNKIKRIDSGGGAVFLPGGRGGFGGGFGGGSFGGGFGGGRSGGGGSTTRF